MKITPVQIASKKPCVSSSQVQKLGRIKVEGERSVYMVHLCQERFLYRGAGLWP